MTDRSEERRLGRVAASQGLCLDGSLCKLGLLTLALFCLEGTSACPRGEFTDDDCRDQVDGEREPVLAIAQRQGVDRREEEEIEASMLAIDTGTA